jgi:uncharacterized protein
MDIIKTAGEFAKENLDENTFLHSLRVRNLALKIARQEKANQKVVELAALLHDIGKPKSLFETHHLKSAEMANSFLRENRVDSNLRAKVISCIKAHMAPRELLPKMIKNFKNKSFPKPVSNEEKCIYDADLLELLGPAGLVKTLNFCLIDYQFSLHKSIEFAQWLTNGAAEGLLTKTAKKIATPLVNLQKEFFKQLDKQMKI